VKIDSPLFKQTLKYDAVGNAIEIEYGGIKNQYTYDGLYQLAAEEGKFREQYSFDSLYNCRTGNGRVCLHQLLSSNEHIYAYDSNGNCLSKDALYYRYDALNRLVAAGRHPLYL
jgi:hypothetical protein